jgi:hypothetical protein
MRMACSVSRGVTIGEVSGPRSGRVAHRIPVSFARKSQRNINLQTSAAQMEDPRTMHKDTPMQKEQQPWPGNVRFSGTFQKTKAFTRHIYGQNLMNRFLS